MAGGFGLKLAAGGLFAADTKKVGVWTSSSRFLLELAENGFAQWGSIPGVKNEASRLTASAAALGRLGAILEATAVSASQAKTLAGAIVKGEDFDIEKQAGELSVNLRDLEKQMAFFETETEDIVKVPWIANAMLKRGNRGLAPGDRRG